MPTQLQFDGPNLERLLARVRDELGSTARIVSAEKVRTGGLAGFFARERFEICVETDDGDGAHRLRLEGRERARQPPGTVMRDQHGQDVDRGEVRPVGSDQGGLRRPGA